MANSRKLGSDREKRTRAPKPPGSAARNAAASPPASEPAPAESPRNPEPDSLETLDFPIAGVGASAGGMDAFSQLLGHLPGDIRMAFVLIQHLDPLHPSLLTQSLARTTPMMVVEAIHGMRVEPNHVYVIPPNTDLAILHGELTLLPRAISRKPHLSIDFFLRSLALEQGDRAIGVLLSGTGSDGTEGLRAIKAEGGITFAQEPRSCKFGDMPKHAILAGVVDNTLPPEQIASELARLSRHPYLSRPTREPSATIVEPSPDDTLKKLLAFVRNESGIDFTDYKVPTIRRRLARRMALRKVGSLDEYVKVVQSDPAEVKSLCEDILIHVTAFFRDPAAFDALKGQVFPEVIARHKDGAPIRIWVPGCSTGEEVYSIAISLLEGLGDAAGKIPIQIFGSDISAQAIEKARTGVYTEAVMRHVSPGQRTRFFTPVEGGYRIGKPVRDLCVFVKHDVARDPPFTKLDLISCRNVLIYFGSRLQKKVVPLFHYCLNRQGFLLLGHTETVGNFTQIFSAVDKMNKIFVKIGESRPADGTPPSRKLVPDAQPGDAFAAAHAAPEADVQRHADHILLGRYAPPGVLVNEKLEIIQIRGRTGPFLELAPGQPSWNLLKIVREGLLPDLRTALQKAKKERIPVRREHVRVSQDQDGAMTTIHLEVIPVMSPPAKESFYLVLFESVPPSPPLAWDEAKSQAKTRKKHPMPEDPQIDRLRQEMAAAKDYLQSLLDERQQMNDELTSGNEELLSTNEELQSTNEEFETTKEELQSSNEELTTVNDELHNRNQELNEVNSDLVNLLASIDIPIVILGGDRRIRRFTPRAKVLMNFIPTDVGRPIDDIKPNIIVPELDERISEVLDTVTLKELEVQDRQGCWYRLQIRPYKTLDNKLDGVVLSLVDIDVLKHAVGEAEQGRAILTGIVETIQVPLVVLDNQLCVLSANQAFYRFFGGSPAETHRHAFFDLGGGAWNIGDFRTELEAILPHRTECQMEIEIQIPSGPKKRIWASASAIQWKGDSPMILLTLLDITERSALLAAAQTARLEAEEANRAKDLFLAVLSHELRTPLSSILLRASRLQHGMVDSAYVKSAGQAIERAARAQAQLIDDLLDVSRVASGKLELNLGVVDLAAVIRSAVDTVRETAEAKSVKVHVDLQPCVGSVSGDAARLQQVLLNLLGNAIKFTPAGGQVAVALSRSGDRAQVRVSDTGRGITPRFLPHVFDRFAQADDSDTRTVGGLGLGLAIVRDLVRLHGGVVQAESAGEGKGASFTVLLPLLPEPKAGPAPDLQNATSQDEASAGAAPSSPDGQQLKGIRLLLVEDDPETRETLGEMLSACGAEIRTANSSSAGMKVLEDFRPHALLCDICMPEEDGYSFIRRVRTLQSEHVRKLPAAALTALASRKDQTRALSAGFQMHLTKPISPEALCGAILKLSGRRNGI